MRSTLILATLSSLLALTPSSQAQTQTFKTGLEVMQAIEARPKPKTSVGTITL